jgi:hypothetical protein
MSTQRRENRWQSSSCTACTKPMEGDFSAPGLLQSHLSANGGTAPSRFANRFRTSSNYMLLDTPDWVATKSLHQEYSSVKFVWIVQVVQFMHLAHLMQQDIGCGSPPFVRLGRTATGSPLTHRSPLARIFPPTSSVHFHPTLPQVPALRCSRAERYDGKRNLHFKHTARNTSCDFGRRSAC